MPCTLHCRRDQSELYSGEREAHHGIKYSAAQFPNGMTALSGPYKGISHAGSMSAESGWRKFCMNCGCVDSIASCLEMLVSA